MSEPKLSIYVPVFNGEGTIGRLLKSLCNQTMKDIRILVSDNASTDDTGRICRNLASRDNRIEYSCNPKNMGILFNCYHTYYAHNSPYSAYAAADLAWKPDFAEKCIKSLEDNQEALIAYPYCEFIDAEGNSEEIYFDRMSFDTPDPETRYLNIIKFLGWNTPLLGIMRHFDTVNTYLTSTSMYPEEFSGDNLFVAGVALKGKIIQVHEPLLLRVKGHHQDGKHNATLVDKHQRIIELSTFSNFMGIRLPAINYIVNHCKLVSHSELPLESKDKLVKSTIEILKERYQHQIQFELQRAISLISQGHYRQSWLDDIKLRNGEGIDRTKYPHLDFSYISSLSQQLDYVLSIFPKFPLLNFARGILYNALGRNKEAQLAIIMQLENTPSHKPSIDFLTHLSKKVA
jgi:glycosyltransferase involved in cell wall biosynthesis